MSTQIKIELVKRGIRQVDFADEINIKEVRLSRIINCRVSATDEELKRIDEYFRINPIKS